jgi:hypothetical protein
MRSLILTTWNSYAWVRPNVDVYHLFSLIESRDLTGLLQVSDAAQQIGEPAIAQWR